MVKDKMAKNKTNKDEIQNKDKIYYVIFAMEFLDGESLEDYGIRLSTKTNSFYLDKGPTLVQSIKKYSKEGEKIRKILIKNGKRTKV